jgi:hypothetical protein
LLSSDRKEFKGGVLEQLKSMKYRNMKTYENEKNIKKERKYVAGSWAPTVDLFITGHYLLV